MDDREGKHDHQRRYEHGLPGYHDPTAGLAGAPTGLSALTLRLWLAGFGAVFCTAAAVAVFLLIPKLALLAWMLAVLAAVAVVDFAWIVHRKRRGEPG